MNNIKNVNVIIITGPTASGKTGTSIRVANDINGEIISADSRQVYKYLDIGTDKIKEDNTNGIRHHLIDIIDPIKIKTKYTADDFINDAKKEIIKITNKNKIPIIVGGTMFYIDALLGNINFPSVPPDHKFRKQMEGKTTDKLFDILKSKDPNRASSLAIGGQEKNKRRIIRALEIIKYIGNVPKKKQSTNTKFRIKDNDNIIDCNAIVIGLKTDKESQKNAIQKRNEKMLDNGLINEVKWLQKKGITVKEFESFGFEYKYPAYLLNNIEIIKDKKPTIDDVLMKMNSNTWRYAKKQLLWWNNRKEISWFAPDDYDTIYKFIESSLRKV